MACTATRQDVSDIVLEVIRAFHGDDTIVEATVFGRDVVVDKLTRRGYAALIEELLSQRFPDCVPGSFGPDDCASAGKVKDIVDALWNDVKS